MSYYSYIDIWLHVLFFFFLFDFCSLQFLVDLSERVETYMCAPYLSQIILLLIRSSSGHGTEAVIQTHKSVNE